MLPILVGTFAHAIPNTNTSNSLTSYLHVGIICKLIGIIRAIHYCRMHYRRFTIKVIKLYVFLFSLNPTAHTAANLISTFPACGRNRTSIYLANLIIVRLQRINERR